MKTVLLIVAGFLVLVGSAFAAAPLPPSTLALGASAPDFTLPATDGRVYTLKDFSEAKVLVVVFTCNHCPTAQYYEERIKALAADYRNRGVAVVAISPNDPGAVRLDELGWADLGDTFDEMKTRARDHKFNFPYLYDGENQAVSRAYGPVATPHVFVFNERRELQYAGAIDDSERVQHAKKHFAREAVEALLAGAKPAVIKTRVIGCSVKWAGKADTVKAFMEKLAAEPVTVARADQAEIEALRKNGSGKFRLVNFWATWCAPCVAEFDELVKINRMYRHREFELVTVSVNRPDEEAAVLEFLKKKQSSGRNLLFASADRDGLMAAFDKDWQGEVPFTVLLSPEGNVVCRQSGSIEPLELRRTILRLMNDRKPW